MTAALTEQSVIFIKLDGQFDTITLLSDSRVQNWFNNSQGGDGLVSAGDFEHVNVAGSYSSVPFLRIDVIVSAAFAATLLLDIPGLRVSFPQYTIATWSSLVTYGT